MATAVCSPAKFFNQSGHRICGDFAWLLPKLTVEVRMIVGVKAALENFSVWQTELKKRAAMRNDRQRFAGLLCLRFHPCRLTPARD